MTNVMEKAEYDTQNHGHPMKLIGGRFRASQKTRFVPWHVFSLWNSLPQDMVMDHGLEDFL